MGLKNHSSSGNMTAVARDQAELKGGRLSTATQFQQIAKKKYTLAVVMDVHTSQDGMVRSFRQSRAPTKWKKERCIGHVLQRSVQCLTLLLPLEEQDETLVVTEGVV